MTPLLFDPRQIRARTCDDLAQLGVPTRAEALPRIFAPDDRVSVRPPRDVEARAAILNIVQARVFDMPPELAMRWLLDAHVLDELTGAEWQFISTGGGDPRQFSDQLESLYALAWVMGLVRSLDPSEYCCDQLPALLPDLRSSESFDRWRGRAGPSCRDAVEVAAMLDLYCCLDWVCSQQRRFGGSLPKGLDESLVWHRRWALEWALVPAGQARTELSRWDSIRI